MRDQVEKITYFIWDGDALAAEVSFSPMATGANAKLDSRFFVYYLNTFEPLVLQCKQQGIGSLAPPEETGYYFYQNDPNGMPLRLYDAEGEIAWSAHYTAFGRIDRLDEIKVKQPLRLQGQYFDEESGLHYNRHRYYDPRTGIFVCQDPIGLWGGINPYQFAANIFSWLDPLGLAKGPYTPKPVTEGSVYRGASSGQPLFSPTAGDVAHYNDTGNMAGISTKPKLNSQAQKFFAGKNAEVYSVDVTKLSSFDVIQDGKNMPV